MLGGRDEGRMLKVAELYDECYAEFVIITPESGVIYSQSSKFSMELGILNESIIERSNAASTYTNAKETLKIIMKVH